MGTIIRNISALELYRTPPVVRDLQLGLDHLCSDTIPDDFKRPRSNAPEEIRTLRDHFLGPLKGLSFPIHLSNTDNHRCRSESIRWHSLGNVNAQDLVAIGEGLFVTSPERTLLDLSVKSTAGRMALLVMEFCGLFADAPENPLTKAALDLLDSDLKINRPSKVLAAYYGIDGRPRAFTDRHGHPLPWQPDPGSHTWKRPPLSTPEALLSFASHAKGMRGSRLLSSAIAMTSPGAGSPLESKIALLLGPLRSRGQEALPAFHLNRRIGIPRDFKELLGTSVLVPDIGWFSEHDNRLLCCCEVDGARHHAQQDERKRLFYDDSTRRSALSHISREVITITYPQVANLEKWDMVLDLIYRAVDLKRPHPTAAFLRRRKELHGELFPLGVAGRSEGSR